MTNIDPNSARENLSLHDLANCPLWVSWRAEKRDGRITKVPYSPRTGACAASDDAASWATRAEAEDWTALHGGDGIGVMLGGERGGIDLDTCIAEDGAMAPWAEAVVNRFASYCEVSPSGAGAKIFFRTRDTDAATIERLFDGKHGRQFKNGATDHPPSIEVYRSNRYFTVTGDLIGDTEILREVSVADLAWLIREHAPGVFPPKDNATGSRDDSRSAKTFRKGAALKANGASYEGMRAALLADEDPDVAAWARTKGMASNEREMRRIYDNAQGCGAEGVTIEDFRAYKPMHSFIFTPCREPWPAISVDRTIAPVPLMKNGAPILDSKGKQIKLPASIWLDQNRAVECMTWQPGEPMIISNRLISNGGWINRNGVSTFNLYRPPQYRLGDPEQAGAWIDHAHRVFGDHATHIIHWLAHRVQRPGEKINHALLFGGMQGVGKDALLVPVRVAIGEWNFHEVSPSVALGRFNGFLKSVILRINEARDLGEVDRFKFYDHTKTFLASPPEVLRIDEKHLREHYIPNCLGVIITSNHKTDGLYLPADDRRHFVAWCDLTKDEFTLAYWNTLFDWYGHGGNEHAAAYLANLDISAFNPKAPPPKTPEFWDIVDASQAPEDAELADILDRLKNPDATTLIRIINEATGSEIEEWLRDRKNRRAIPYRLERCGYVPVRNDCAKDGLWKLNGTRQAVYVRSELSIRDRLRAAQRLVGQSSQ